MHAVEPAGWQWGASSVREVFAVVLYRYYIYGPKERLLRFTMARSGLYVLRDDECA